MKRLADQNLYEILEVPLDAHPAVIAEAVERARSLYEPGSLATYTLMSTEEAALLSRRIDEAQATLLDPAAKARYDLAIGAKEPPDPPAPVTEAVNGHAVEETAEVEASADRERELQAEAPAADLAFAAATAGAEAPSPAEAPSLTSPEAAAPAEAPAEAPAPASPEAEAASPAEAPPFALTASPAQAETPATVEVTAPAEALAPGLQPELPLVAAAPEPEPEVAAPPPEPVPGPVAAAPEPPAPPPVPAPAPVPLSEVVAPPPLPRPIPIQLSREVAFPAPTPPPAPQVVPPPAPTPLPLVVQSAPPPDLISADTTVWSGEVLRRLREARGLTVHQLCARTKVTRHHIENIEADRYGALPAAVYLRGILLSLARELRLDGQKVARSYLERVTAAAQVAPRK